MQHSAYLATAIIESLIIAALLCLTPAVIHEANTSIEYWSIKAENRDVWLINERNGVNVSRH